MRISVNFVSRPGMPALWTISVRPRSPQVKIFKPLKGKLSEILVPQIIHFEIFVIIA